MTPETDRETGGSEEQTDSFFAVCREMMNGLSDGAASRLALRLGARPWHARAVTTDDCIFCKIVRGEAPAHKVHEDDRVLVFMDIFPVTDGHTLIVTKEHFENLFETTEESLRAVTVASLKVAHAIQATLDPDGLMVFQLNGVAAGQSVFHYHMHLLPRMQGEPLALHTRVPGDPQRLREISERLTAALADG
jgi:histidine triad (HIT) family protein